MKTLTHFKEFVDEILKSNSRNYKMEILRKYSKDEEIRAYLNFIYNPYIVTGISEKKLGKEIDDGKILADDFPYNSVFGMMEYLINHNTGKDIDLHFVNSYRISEIDPDLWDLYDAIVTKDLQLGVDVLSINKCMGNFISTFSVQLANKYFEKPEYVEGKEFFLTSKIDGGRIIAIKKNSEINFYTRAGQKYEGLIDLEKEMLEKIPDNTCLDGEITLLDKGNLASKDQYKATMKIVRKDGIKHGVKMLVFDMMTADEFISQTCNIPYYHRRESMQQLFSHVSLTFFNLLPVLYKGRDTSEITRILNEQVSAGEEGIMINIADAPYQFKRTSDLLKVKLFDSADLKIVNFEEGTGKNKNKLGAFICEYKDSYVKVGSGLSDRLREEVWNNRKNYLGSIIEVGYFEETVDKDGIPSLRFPTFKAFRFDKNEPNY